MKAIIERELGGGDAIWVPTIGYPARQIKWSLLLNGLFRSRGLNGVATAIELPPESLASFLEVVRASSSVHGFSATIPHKIPLAGMVDRLTPRAMRARAVNVVFKDQSDGTLTGDMIDGIGFLKSLEDNGVPLSGRKLLVFGAGGVSRAIASALLDQEVAAIHVADLAPHRAEELSEIDPDRIRPIALESAQADVARFDIVVNATPLGLKDDDPLPFDPSACAEGACIFDVINRPDRTPLGTAARARGIRYIDGAGMLEAQIDTFLDLIGFA